MTPRSSILARASKRAVRSFFAEFRPAYAREIARAVRKLATADHQRTRPTPSPEAP